MGSDIITTDMAKTKLSFNPRSHMGSDVSSGNTFFISLSFNPRSHMGSDIMKKIVEDIQKEFQSTLPHGERPYASIG